MLTIKQQQPSQLSRRLFQTILQYGFLTVILPQLSSRNNGWTLCSNLAVHSFTVSNPTGSLKKILSMLAKAITHISNSAVVVPGIQHVTHPLHDFIMSPPHRSIHSEHDVICFGRHVGILLKHLSRANLRLICTIPNPYRINIPSSGNPMFSSS